MAYMSGKIRKTFYIPAWIAEILEEEGALYGGPGVVVSTAINTFCKLSVSQKKKALQDFRQVEIDHAYSADAIVDAAEADVKANPKKQGHRPSRSA